MSARTDAVVPASTLSRSSRLKPPRPPCAITASAVSAGMKSSSLASDIASRTDRPEQDLVLLERRRLEHNANAVGQRPFGDPHASVGSTWSRPRRPRADEQAMACCWWCRRTPSGSAPLAEPITPASVTSFGIVALSLSGAEIATRRLRSGIQSLATAFTSASEISGEEALVQAVFVDDARNRLFLGEVADEFVGERTRRALVLLDDGALKPALQLSFIRLNSGG